MWIKNLERQPPAGVKTKCRIQHCSSKRVEEHEMLKVEEGDCDWRFANDGGEVSFDWTLVEWWDSSVD